MSKYDFTFIAVILFLMFLFVGDPDVFDALIETTRNWLLK